jgi:hypothetical protein
MVTAAIRFVIKSTHPMGFVFDPLTLVGISTGEFITPDTVAKEV